MAQGPSDKNKQNDESFIEENSYWDGDEYLCDDEPFVDHMGYQDEDGEEDL